MNLLSLPPEILEKICKSFCTHWVKALVNLSETCQVLDTFTLPHHYHRIELKSDILYIKAFIAQITGRGQNALNHVRSLSLTYTKAKDACTSFELALRHVPQVQLLHIRLSLKHEIKTLPQTMLKSLRYLHIEQSDKESQHSTLRRQIYELLRMAPKLDTLVVQVAEMSWSFGSGGLENVKCLKIINTLVSPTCLRMILDACSQLESFIFSYSARETIESITPQTLPQALSIRQETLRYVEFYWEPQAVNDSGMEIVGSFKDLVNLETLILGGPGFRFERAEDKKTLKTCLFNLLPQSIRSVIIDSERVSLHEPILALGEAVKQGSFPMLKENSSAEVNTGLPSLARTCRVLNNAATPYIYHNIDAKRWSEQKINEFLKDRRQLHKRCFIRRLTYELDPFPLYTLLYRMPDLELLCLVDRGTFGQTLASEGQKKLHDLRYLHLERGTSSGSTRDLSTLENLFEMAPNINTLVINSGVLEWKTKLRNSPKVPLANLTCLKLYNVSVNLETLERILDNCGPVESFVYGLYQPLVALCQAKQAGSFPELRSFLQANFDISQVPYALGNLSELSERYKVSFKQEARSIFPPPVAARPPRLIHWMRCAESMRDGIFLLVS
ncbi:hypothetical protein FPCIR_1308 [Fusarium pseudocircinatum]|uniref:Uncharacterized protein n=1 Tax=Fusarium pseudocircinatum TaxID=56676 RepID=A0A8H5PUN8_9HYPO|nr:hypothetical protein FPCIR_1308 [Fusarium pseudocircinatum]